MTFLLKGETNSDNKRKGMYSPKGVKALLTYVVATSPLLLHIIEAFCNPCGALSTTPAMIGVSDLIAMSAI